MKISSIIDIVAGTLQNSPAISFITQSHTNLSKINDGDMFISSSFDDIQIAISKGAFAIIYDIDIDISTLDNEIAWIKVNNLDKAIIRLLRFNLSLLNLKSYLCDEICFEFLYISKSYKKELIFLTSDTKSNFELLNNISNNSIPISTNHKFIYDILPTTLELNIQEFDIKNLVVHSLFETSFSYKEQYFYKLKLPLIYIEFFLTIIDFLDIQTYDTSKLNNFSFFKPIFIDKHTQIVDFGKSNRFIIVNNNTNIANIELKFINQIYKYGKIKIIDNIIDDELLFKTIEENNYNALYIKHKTQEDIITLLRNNQKNFKKLF